MHVVAKGVVASAVALTALTIGAGGASAGPAVPLPPPPALPPATPPQAVEPVLAVAGPTVGAACGTASLGALLTPSLLQGFFHIPLDQIIDGHTLTEYANTALYVCGFIPAPLTPSQCAVDAKILDALRGLNPLAAQIVGLYPEGAAVDTVLEIEQLIPSSTTVARPAVAALSHGLTCSRSAGVPPAGSSTCSSGTTPSATEVPAVLPAPTTAPWSPAPRVALLAPAPPRPHAASVVTSPPARPAAPSAPGTPLARIFEARFVPRAGLQWLALALGIILLTAAAGAWWWTRDAEAQAA